MPVSMKLSLRSSFESWLDCVMPRGTLPLKLLLPRYRLVRNTDGDTFRGRLPVRLHAEEAEHIGVTS
jgi:hypothetical protein